MPETKTCSRCSMTKPLNAFATDKRYTQGVTGWCRECKRAHGREYGERQLRSAKPCLPFKTCTHCRERKEADAFALCPTKKSGLSSRCKECRAALEISPSRNLSARKSYPKNKYGLDEDKLKSMLAEQDNLCACCLVGLEGGRFEIDHCHSTGRVRGLVCARCNRWLAAVDHPSWLGKALGYAGRVS
jgi:hypothetical protein